jgi:nucleoside 2-deoxyribosyltransferase
MEHLVIYLAAGLFNAPERVHNLYLERALKKIGREVILPQREALNFFRPDKTFDIPGIAEDCSKKAVNQDNILVGSADGTDADSGFAVEYGIALVGTGRAIVYRTDLRTALERELGVNAMLTLKGTEFLYDPCFITEFEEIEPYYDSLAQKIDSCVCEIELRM